ncbi:FecR family protein [Polaribacter sp. Asnod1-A03]|uniref:FecR family protein n=1 Tax=Polaribacter sp. Asnod1-A03 TaxID=3160581 RepID=UPI00386A4E4C
MTKNNTKYDISKIIYKSIIKSTNKDEELFLNSWLENSNNKQLYNSILQIKVIENKKQLYLKSNKKVVFSRIEEKISKSKKVSTRNVFFKRMLKYAAVIVSFLAINHFYFKDNSDRYTQKAIKEIKPGTNKAILILDDGTKLNLENSKDQLIKIGGNAQIANVNNQLIYNSNSVKKISKKEKKIASFNTLIVPVGGMYQLVLPDSTKVWMNSKSSLRYPVFFNEDQRIVELVGEAYFDVTKSSKEFIVKTKTADITVLGTRFNVSSYLEDECFSSTLVEGSIKLNTKFSEPKSVLLKPGQRITSKKTKVTVKNVDTSIYTSWIDGKFYFERETLDNILTKISRWYNVKVSFETEDLKSKIFTGVASKNMSIEHLLNLIRKTTNVDYKILNKKDDNVFELVIVNKQ